MNRRLYRCRENRMLAGVAGGVAEYFAIDASLVRLVWFASIFFGGLGVLLYVAMVFIVPLEPLTAEAAAAHAASAAATPLGHVHRPSSGWLMTGFGVVLLVIGGIALLDVALPGWATWRQLWPIVFIAAGAVLLLTSMRRHGDARTPVTASGPIAEPAPDDETTTA